MSKSSSPSNIIKINLENSQLVNPLSTLEYESLKNSIKEDGLHYPIVINSKGEILDGHQRYKICKDLDIPIKYKIKYFDNPIEEKRFVIDINLKRRQLNDFQKAELAYKLEDLYKQQARLRQLSKLKNVKEKIASSLGSTDHNDKDDSLIEKDALKGRTIEIISKNNDLSPKTYQRAKTIIENATEEIKEKLRANKTTISKEYDKIQRDLKRQELLSKLSNIQDNKNDVNQFQNSNYKLIYGDFIDQSQKEIADSSVDLILSDPPYGREYLPLYHELANLAVRVLKPGGSLVFYVCHIILDQVIGIFNNFSLTNNNRGLKYFWILAVKHSGHHTKIHPRYVFAEWKPMLWYVKGERVNDLAISNTIGDYVESVAPTKIEHEWQQSTIEAEYIIKNLTLQNQTILDPMMGSGTTGIAALNLKRKFIGIEKNPEPFEIAKASINKQEFERIKEGDS